MFPRTSRYELLPGLLLGFHGTDEEIAEKILAGEAYLQESSNPYDWLGNGIYFWEYSPQRALEFATQSLGEPRLTQGNIKKPAVIGVVIDPGLCLNMLEASALAQARFAYEILELTHDGELPQNKGGHDLRARFLDCAVMETLHQIREATDLKLRTEGQPALPPYDTVRGAFWEGDDLYPNAGFKAKNHVQICVRNPNCIKGYFRVIPD